jgi:hypothetical protein
VGACTVSGAGVAHACVLVRSHESQDLSGSST